MRFNAHGLADPDNALNVIVLGLDRKTDENDVNGLSL
jgi:hypothetical protein